MSHMEPIKQEKRDQPKSYLNYYTKLLKKEQENKEYKEKILKFLKIKLPQTLVKEQPGPQKKKKKTRPENQSDEDPISSQEQLGGLSPFYQRYMMGAPEVDQNGKQVKNATEQQLCEILKIIKQKNKKTSIQLMIKMLHQIICPNQTEGFTDVDQLMLKKKTQISLRRNKQTGQNRFKNYDIRFRQYKERIRVNYLPDAKLQDFESKIKTEENESLFNQNVTPISQKFIQFSTPYHVVEYFKHKNTRAFRRHLDRQPYGQRRYIFKEFCLKGHTMPDYNQQRKTAKIFCLVGPGVRAARPFMGDDLGSHTHSKTISNIVKTAYRNLQQYINDNLNQFLKPNQLQDHQLSQTQSYRVEGEQYPSYYASRRELSGIKTPLFNCRNWMNDQELELFFLFVKKSYRIIYPKEWQHEKIKQIFLLFGRIIKKLMERDILVRNLQVLKGQDVVNTSRDQKFFAISPEAGVIQLTKRQKDQIQRQKRKQEKLKQRILSQNLSKTESRKQLFKKKYQKYANSFRSNEQADDQE